MGLLNTLVDAIPSSPLVPTAADSAASQQGSEGSEGSEGSGGDSEVALLSGARICLQALLMWLTQVGPVGGWVGVATSPDHPSLL